MKVSKEEIALALDANSSNLVMSINEPIQNGSSSKTTSLEELIPDNQSQEAKLAERLTLNKLIEELGEQEKKIVILRYFKEQTQSEVAKKLGISQVQVSRIEKKILISMKSKLA